METLVADWRRQWFALARSIRARKYDVLILPHAKPFPLQLASLFSGVPHRLAMWAGWPGRLTLHRCLRSRLLEEPRPFADILLDCARALDIPPDGLLPEIFFDRPGLVPAKSPTRPRIGLHPGSGGNACNLAPLGYEALATLILQQTDWEIVLTGSAQEKPLLSGWDPGILSSPRLRNTLGQLSLPALAEEIEALDLFVSTGTGPFHMAAALGTPTLTPFCNRIPISRRVWGNLRPNGHYLETQPEQCQGMPFEQCCNFNGKISPEDLFKAARQAIPGPRRSPG